MAIYHTRIKTFSRAKEHSSIAAAAYRAGLLLIDERGTRHDYRRRGGVVETRCVAPDEAPDWAFVPSQLWVAAEAAERRKDATVAREFEIALPHELNDAQRSELVSALARALVERYGFAVQASIHEPDSPGGLNYHAHILATTRRISNEGLNDKTRELDGGASGRIEVEWTREMVANTINAHLKAAQIDARVDHRSLEAQADAALARGDVPAAIALTRQPTQHIGKDATALQRKGEDTERVQANLDIADGNDAHFEALLAQFEQLGRAMPVPKGHDQERARRERSNADASAPSRSDGEIRIVRGLRGLRVRPAEDDSQILATHIGRKRAATVALEEAARLWEEGFVASVDNALEATGRVIRHRAELLGSFVRDAPFAVYVRELVRRLKKLKHDVSRLARRKAAAKRAETLLHQAHRALEHFDAEHPRPTLWSRQEWAKRRTRRLADVETRTKVVRDARHATTYDAEQAYLTQTRASAAALEEWSVDILKRYPIESDGTVAAIPTPPAAQEPASEVERADDSIAASGSRRKAPKFS
ncbi:MAG: MobA/MobL family protein [Lysobacteraceae bacterium]